MSVAVLLCKVPVGAGFTGSPFGALSFTLGTFIIVGGWFGLLPGAITPPFTVLLRCKYTGIFRNAIAFFSFF